MFVISLSICYWLFKCWVLHIMCVWEREGEWGSQRSMCVRMCERGRHSHTTRAVAITAIMQYCAIEEHNPTTAIFACFLFLLGYALLVLHFMHVYWILNRLVMITMCTMLICTEASRFALNKPKQTADERERERLISCDYLCLSFRLSNGYLRK